MPVSTLASIFEKYPLLLAQWSGNDRLHEEFRLRPPHFTFDINTFKGGVFQQNNGVMSDYQSEMECREFSIPEGVHVMKAKLHSETSGYIRVTAARPYLHLYFAINNNRSYYTQDQLLDALCPGELQLFFFHQEDITGVWHTLPHDHFVEVNIDPAFLATILAQEHPIHAKLDQLVVKQMSGALFAKPKKINNQLHRILEELGLPMVQEELLPLLTKAKLMELFAYVFDEEVSTSNDHRVIQDQVSKEMLLLMEKAKAVLDEKKANPPSISDLAVLLGTNENYLKKYFKLCYHMTIYGYVRHIRMQAAMELLHKKEKSINEISRFLGYTSPAHFSSSFKKHFGVKPKKIQQTIT